MPRNPTARLWALNILKEHPGLNASQFARIMWPHLVQMRGTKRSMVPNLKAAQYLGWLRDAGYARRKYSGDPFKESAWAVYFLSDLGYEVCENQNRNSRSGLSRSSGWRARPIPKRSRAKTFLRIGVRVSKRGFYSGG